MNRIERLVKEKCPKGVKYQKLFNVCNILRGSRLTKKELSDDYKYTVYHGGLIPLGKYMNYNREGKQTMVINTGSVGEVVWSEDKFWASDGTYTIETPEHLKDKFIYYILKNKEIFLKTQRREGGVPTLNIGSLENLEIPIPPIEIQEEIVKILDKFSELEAELEAELELRVKQYEFCRGKLLNNRTNLEILDKLLDYIQPTKYIVTNTQYADTYETPVLTAGKTLLLGYTDDTTGIFKASKNNEVIIFDDFTTSNHWIDFDFKVKSSAMKMLVPRNQDNHFKYIYYNIENINYKPMTHARQWIQTYSKFEIPLPSYNEQVLIVKQLDRFNDLIKNMKYGLPAEIELRRKQYEYYRNKLLTFDELKTN